jgi:hypothetical protein
MKTNLLERSVSTQGMGAVIQGTMKQSAKNFSILIDNMYSNKPQSIVREIMSNAWDAHVDAGVTDKPFSVSFPSLFNPMFTVRDYGKGLSHEFMTKEYTVLGHSSKEDSNDMVGSWGLGRLTPLSYVDTYTVTSYQGSRARHYTIVRNEGGIGFIYIGETKTDEPDGLQVSFPIARPDIESFRKAFRIVSLGFDVKPTIIKKQQNDEWPELPVAAQGTGWKLINNSGLPSDHPMRSGAFVRMGCVIYPLSGVEQIEYSKRNVLKSPILFEAPIGSLAVTASREALSFGKNDPTLQTINDMIDNMTKEASAVTIEAVAKAPNWFTANKIVTDSRFFTGTMRDYIRKNAVWHGQPVNGYINMDKILDGVGHRVAFGKKKSWGQNQYSLKRLNLAGSITPDIDWQIIIANVTKGKKGDVRVNQRVQQFWQDCGADGLIYVRYDEDRPDWEKQLKLLLDRLDGVPVEYVKNTPDSGVTKRGTTSKPVSAKVLQSSGVWWDTSLDQKERDAGGFYVPLLDGSVDHPNSIPVDNAVAILRHLKLLPDTSPVIGVPKTIRNKFDKSVWTNIYDLLDKFWEDNSSDLTVLANQYQVSGSPEKVVTNIGAVNSLFKKYLQQFDYKLDSKLKIGARDAWLYFRHYNRAGITPSNSATVLFKDIVTKYPLLEHHRGYADQKVYSALKDYVQAMDYKHGWK